jgi:hypothetical protein
MAPLTFFPITIGLAIGLTSVTLDSLDIIAQASLQSLRLYQLYGLTGLNLSIFGSRTTWCLEAQVLCTVRDEDALAFKSSVQVHCTMVSVAVCPLQDRSNLFFS